MNLKLLYVPFPDENSAKILAHQLLEKKLALCCNVLPQVQSIYLWENKIHEDSEVLMLVKTTTPKETAEYIESKHTYDIPVVLEINVDAMNEKYQMFIKNAVPFNC